MQSCRADQAQGIGELEEGSVSSLPCRAQTFPALKAGDSQSLESERQRCQRGGADEAASSLAGVRAAMRRCIHLHLSWERALAQQPWVGDSRSWVVLCWSEELIMAHSGNEKRQKPSTPCLSLSYHELIACGWVGSISVSALQWSIAEWSCCPPFRHLPSPQPAWTGNQQKCLLPLLFWSHKSHNGFCQAIYTVFSWLRASPFNVRILVGKPGVCSFLSALLLGLSDPWSLVFEILWPHFNCQGQMNVESESSWISLCPRIFPNFACWGFWDLLQGYSSWKIE